MADYLTHLARRSLGELRPVEPVRIHPYAESTTSGDGHTEDSSFGRVGIEPALKAADRGLPHANENEIVISASGRAPSTSLPDGTVVETGAVVSAAKVEDHRDSGAFGPAGVAGQQSAPSPAGRQGRPNRVAGRNIDEDQELLVPGLLNRSDRRPDPNPVAASTESEPRTGGPPSDPSSTADRAERSREPATLPRDATRGDRERSDLASRSSVEVSIGTIEIRATPPQTFPEAPRACRVRPKLGLDDYLAQRRRGER